MNYTISTLLENSVGIPTSAKVFTTTVHTLLGTISIPINEIMIRYLQNKSPGRQTFLDRLLIDNHRIFQILNLVCHSTIILGTWGAPDINSKVTFLLGRLCHLFPFLFFSSICSYFLAKYTYVFKSVIFNGEIDEENILKWIRVFNATVAINLNLIGN